MDICTNSNVDIDIVQLHAHAVAAQTNPSDSSAGTDPEGSGPSSVMTSPAVLSRSEHRQFRAVMDPKRKCPVLVERKHHCKTQRTGGVSASSSASRTRTFAPLQAELDVIPLAERPDDLAMEAHLHADSSAHAVDMDGDCVSETEFEEHQPISILPLSSVANSVVAFIGGVPSNSSSVISSVPPSTPIRTTVPRPPDPNKAATTCSQQSFENRRMESLLLPEDTAVAVRPRPHPSSVVLEWNVYEDFLLHRECSNCGHNRNKITSSTSKRLRHSHITQCLQCGTHTSQYTSSPTVDVPGHDLRSS